MSSPPKAMEVNKKAPVAVPHEKKPGKPVKQRSTDHRSSKRKSKSNSKRKSTRRPLPVFPEKEYEIIQGIDPDTIFDRLSPLGTGSFGTVYEVRHKETKGEYALKTIKETDKHGVQDDLKKEIGFLRHCHSPFVCEFFDAYHFGDRLALVLELFECGSVHDLMKMAKVNFTVDFIRDVTAQLVLALDFLQRQRVIHRDIKAGNALLTTSGQTKLCDFGVSKFFSESTTESISKLRTKTVIGTPYWMSPEIVLELGYTFTADIWSLGITLIELKDGNPPYSRIDPFRAMYIAQRRPPPKFARPKEQDEEMSNFLACCLVKEADHRSFAGDLLTHKFIAKTVDRLSENSEVKFGSDIVKDCVTSNLPNVRSFRANTKFIDEDNLAELDSHATSNPDSESFIKIGKPAATHVENKERHLKDEVVEAKPVKYNQNEKLWTVRQSSIIELNTKTGKSLRKSKLRKYKKENPVGEDFDFNSLVIRGSVLTLTEEEAEEADNKNNENKDGEEVEESEDKGAVIPRNESKLSNASDDSLIRVLSDLDERPAQAQVEATTEQEEVPEDKDNDIEELEQLEADLAELKNATSNTVSILNENTKSTRNKQTTQNTQKTELTAKSEENNGKKGFLKQLESEVMPFEQDSLVFDDNLKEMLELKEKIRNFKLNYLNDLKDFANSYNDKKTNLKEAAKRKNYMKTHVKLSI